MKERRVAITTLGCKTNQFESAAIQENLLKEGFSVVPFDAEADVYVINTCTVTARTDAESRRLIRRARRRSPGARIVVTGCYAQVAPDIVNAFDEVALVVGNEEKKRLAALLKEEQPERVHVADIGLLRKAEALPLETFAEHTRAFLQVQNGCDSFCSYCIVPFARGRSRSVAPDAVMSGVSRFVRQGFREVVLTGIHLGAYGRDLEPACCLLDLLEMMQANRVTSRLRLGSLEPLDITPGLIAFLCTSPMVCHHLHIPLQSGSDRVLSLMNRGYTGDYFRGLVMKLVDGIPDVAIGLDVIAGFPGETDEDFLATCRLIEELPIAYLHVFPFSSRPGTAAATMAGHLHAHSVTERAARLRHLGEAKKRAYHEGFLGAELDVLVMQQGDDGLWNGISRNYIPVAFAGTDSMANTEIRLRITDVTGDRLIGIIC